MYIPGSPLSQPWLTIVSAKFDTSCTFWSDPPKLASDQAQGPPRRLTSLEPTRVVFSQRPLVVVLDGGLWAWSQGIGMDTGEGYGEWSRQAWISSWYIIWNHKISALDRPWKSQSHQAIDHRPPPKKNDLAGTPNCQNVGQKSLHKSQCHFWVVAYIIHPSGQALDKKFS